MEVEVLRKKCPRCGKEIISLYKDQLEHNWKVHVISCVESSNQNERREEDE